MNIMDKRMVSEFFIFVTENAEGEGVMAVASPNGLVPLVAATIKTVHDLKPLADATGNKYKVFRFCKRKNITKEVTDAGN